MAPRRHPVPDPSASPWPVGGADLFGGPGPAPPSPPSAREGARPLADRLRPTRLAEVAGQDHLVGPEGSLTRMLARGSLASLVLWGPPGVGKTTIARLLAGAAGLDFQPLSAVFSGVADLKRVFAEAAGRRGARRGTLLFVDEIHRFNRAQQDGFLGPIEEGTVVLVGATTENPSFALNGALLSRCQVLVLHRLDDGALEALLARAEAAVGRALPLDAGARKALRSLADGDGRHALNLAEQVLALPAGTPPLDAAGLAPLLARRAALHDRDGEQHFNLISALHKALRGSDPDAALYWFARLLEGGEDPRYVARRLVRFASEDVGGADPAALPLALAAWQAWERLGTPEGDLALAQAVVHLAAAPKSNAVYAALQEARAAARETGGLPPPDHALNAPTALMRDLGRGRGYAYDHDAPDGFGGQDHFPAGLARRVFYRPAGRGAEAAVAARLAAWAALRAGRGDPGEDAGGNGA